MTLPSEIDVALWLATRTVAGLPAEVCDDEVAARLADALQVPAAVLLTVDPAVISASDGEARFIGQAQQRADGGPLLGVLRNGRPLVVPDLTRVGPPALAASAAESGLVSAVTVPLSAEGRPVGALQLLGTVDRPATPHLLETSATVARVLATRLADRMVGHSRPVRDGHDAVVEQAVGMLAARRGTHVTAARRYLETFAQQTGTGLVDAAGSVLAGTTRPAVVPAPRAASEPMKPTSAPRPRAGRSPVESTTTVLRPPRHRRAAE